MGWWHIKHREEGDPDNTRLSKAQRASRSLYGAVSEEYGLSKGSKNRGRVGAWVADLYDDAEFNFRYARLLQCQKTSSGNTSGRRKIPLSPEAKREAKKWKRVEKESKGKGNISIPIRKQPNASSYLSMNDLAYLVDKPKDPLKEARLARDANEYKPIRDAVAHTALLTDVAKTKLSTVRENIKGRIKTILS